MNEHVLHLRKGAIKADRNIRKYRFSYIISDSFSFALNVYSAIVVALFQMGIS
jgi:hypothetical protein